MPQLSHEVLVQLFLDAPELVCRLLEETTGVTVPRFHRVELGNVDLSQATPTEYRADAVVQLTVDRGKPALAVVVEVQLRRDAGKRRTWPAYVANLHRRLGCPVELLVLAPDPRVARWAREPIHVSSGFTLAPRVVDFASVPQVRSVEKALELPELALLSALAHRDEPAGADAAVATVLAAARLQRESRTLYWDLVSGVAAPEVRSVLEEMMLPKGWEPVSEVGKRSFAKGKREGRELGRREGRQEGRQEGQAEALVEALLAVLEARGLAVEEDVGARVRAQRDVAVLRQWVRRAAVVADAGELFADAAA